MPIFNPDNPEEYMKVTPFSDEELTKQQEQARMLLEPGEYAFEVIEATDAVSSKGNEMIKLGLKVYRQPAGSRFVKDCVLEKMPHKLKHFAFSTGLGQLYLQGGFNAADCIGRTGRAMIIVEQYNGKDTNKVEDYVVPTETEMPSGIPKADHKTDDSIPF
jgi:hypothetical protein